MKRSGIVTLLGAGASTDAGYPMANALLDQFETALEEVSCDEIRDRAEIERRLDQEAQESTKTAGKKMIPLPVQVRPQPTTREWFQTMWDQFTQVTRKLRPLRVPRLASDGRPELSSPVVYGPSGLPSFPPYTAPLEGDPPSKSTPYLETFFAFYDDYMRPMIVALHGDPAQLQTAQYRFRRLRELAVKTAYRAFAPIQRSPANYLARLFELPGPAGFGSVIATLNFDVAVEQVASNSGLPLFDGFAPEPLPSIPPPFEWRQTGLETLDRLWGAVVRNAAPFLGFKEATAGNNLLLKLHGSLGWYVVEEGSGEIGYRDELRHNTTYGHFRLPCEYLWKSNSQEVVDKLALGGPDDPVMRVEEDAPSRKAGAVWVRPYLVFARALKAHPDRVSLDLMSTLARLLDSAAAILVIGYSWGDPHVNDLIFDAVGRGARLVNLSLSPRPPNTLALWMYRFPTTFHVLRRRLFMIGGGAERVLQASHIDLPNGKSLDLDLIEAMNQGLPAELSLEAALN